MFLGRFWRSEDSGRRCTLRCGCLAADTEAVVVDDVGVDGVDGVAEGDVRVDGRESVDERGG